MPALDRINEQKSFHVECLVKTKHTQRSKLRYGKLPPTRYIWKEHRNKFALPFQFRFSWKWYFVSDWVHFRLVSTEYMEQKCCWRFCCADVVTFKRADALYHSRTKKCFCRCVAKLSQSEDKTWKLIEREFKIENRNFIKVRNAIERSAASKELCLSCIYVSIQHWNDEHVRDK